MDHLHAAIEIEVVALETDNYKVRNIQVQYHNALARCIFIDQYMVWNMTAEYTKRRQLFCIT
jgi:hypothetical protein